MDPFEFGMSVHRQGDTSVVTLRGDLDIRDAGRVRRQLDQLGGSQVVVDLLELTFMDARGLAALLSGRDGLVAQGNEMVIRNARGVVRRVFEVTGLVDLLDGHRCSPDGSRAHDPEKL